MEGKEREREMDAMKSSEIKRRRKKQQSKEATYEPNRPAIRRRRRKWEGNGREANKKRKIEQVKHRAVNCGENNKQTLGLKA